MVARKVETEHNFRPTNRFVCKVFRNDLGMKYKKVKKIAFQGNSERSLVLRQQFSIKLLELLE